MSKDLSRALEGLLHVDEQCLICPYLFWLSNSASSLLNVLLRFCRSGCENNKQLDWKVNKSQI